MGQLPSITGVLSHVPPLQALDVRSSGSTHCTRTGTCTRTQAPAPVLEITGVGAPSFVPLLQVCTVVTGALPSLPWLYLLDFSYLWAGLCLILHFYST